ncbi:MAG TPA: M48 family metallopeptidase, partial [Thermoanaerobaculia bacterium]
MNRNRRTYQIAAIVVALVILPATTDAQSKVKSGFNLFSPEQDVEIGQQSAAEAEKQLPIIANREIASYVDRIGQRLSSAAPGPKFRYQFRVVDASDLNAFALPGGYVYLNRGILESAKSEGEVAGVLAHEIAHVALRHGTHNASKAYMTQAGIGILGGLLGGKMGGNSTQIINAVGGIGLNVLFLKYTREAEKDADVLGVQMLAKSGYSPGDMVSFFQTLAKT